MEQHEDRVLYGFWLSPYMSIVAHVLKEAGLPFQYERVSPYIGDTQSKAHKSRNPLGKIPCLKEPSGLIISESQAICRYISRSYAEAQKFYPCDDPAKCSEVDAVNDFLTFSISGPFFNWFVVGGYFPQAWHFKTEQESSVFSSWSLIINKTAMARLMETSKMSPFLLGSQPCLPDFHLFHILELGKTFSKIFDMPFLNLLSGDETLQKFYDAMASRSSTQEILEAKALELEQTKREIREEFGPAYQDALAPAKVALGGLYGHDV